MNLLLAVSLGHGSKTESFSSLPWESVKNRYQRALRLHDNNESGFTYIFEVSEALRIGLCSSCRPSALGSLCVSVSVGPCGSETGVSRSRSGDMMAQPGAEA